MTPDDPPASPAPPKPKKRGLFGSLPRLGTPKTSLADNSTSVKLAMRNLIEERDELKELLRVREQGYLPSPAPKGFVVTANV